MGENTSKQHIFLKMLAYIGQFAALFPFAVALEVGVGGFTPWHFAAIYGVWASFWAIGLLFACLVRRVKRRASLPKKLVPIMSFLLKIGFFVPTALFVTAFVLLSFNVAVYFFVLSGGIVIYFGGCFGLGRNYSEIYSKSWLALYIILSIFLTIFFAVSEQGENTSAGSLLLCVGFAFIVMVTALVANQSNIDNCTNRRDRGKSVLPWGLRRYNALIGLGVFAVALGAFAFAKPVGKLLGMLLVMIIRGFMYIAKVIDSWLFPSDEPIKTDPSSDRDFDEQAMFGSGSANDVILIVMLVVLIVMIIVFRRGILGAIKSFFAQLFKDKRRESDAPFADEITSGTKKPPTARMKRKAERDLERRYLNEKSPERRYRLGYELLLLRLAKTSQPPKPADTTDIHREKAESAFGEDLSVITETYNRVRYADARPTAKELDAELELLQKIK